MRRCFGASVFAWSSWRTTRELTSMLQLADLTETLDMLDRLPGKFTVAEACQTFEDKSKFAVHTKVITAPLYPTTPDIPFPPEQSLFVIRLENVSRIKKFVLQCKLIVRHIL